MAIGHWNESVLDLIPAYRATRKALTQARERAKAEQKAWDEERRREGATSAEIAEAASMSRNWEAEAERIGGMLGDVDYTLQWLETGRKPGQLRGVERRYERAWDPAWIDRYHSPSGWTVERESVSRELTEDERFRIEEAMRDLSARERQCYMMHEVDGMSFGEIAAELHTAKGTVQGYVENARRKIEDAKLTNLFLV